MFVIIHNNKQYFWKIVDNLSLFTFDPFQTTIYRTYGEAKSVLDKIPNDKMFDWKIAELKPVIK